MCFLAPPRSTKTAALRFLETPAVGSGELDLDKWKRRMFSFARSAAVGTGKEAGVPSPALVDGMTWRRRGLTGRFSSPSWVALIVGTVGSAAVLRAGSTCLRWYTHVPSPDKFRWRLFASTSKARQVLVSVRQRIRGVQVGATNGESQQAHPPRHVSA